MSDLLEDVVATLRSRGRIYGVRDVLLERVGGSPLLVTFLVSADDWLLLQPRHGRAPRNDLRLQADVRGNTYDLQRGSRLRYEVARGDRWIRVSAVFPVEHAVLTPGPVVHAPVCSGCRKPWPCEGAA